MLALKARVKDGRLVLNEPTDLPEGEEVLLEVAEQDDDLDDEDRARLHAALERSVAQAQVGRLVPAATVMSKLRPDR